MRFSDWPVSSLTVSRTESFMMQSTPTMALQHLISNACINRCNSGFNVQESRAYRKVEKVNAHSRLILDFRQMSFSLQMIIISILEPSSLRIEPI